MKHTCQVNAGVRDERGMSTSEFAVGTLGVAGIAGAVMTILRPEVMDVVQRLFEAGWGEVVESMLVGRSWRDLF